MGIEEFGRTHEQQCNAQYRQADDRDDPPDCAWRSVFKTHQHLVLAPGHPQCDEALRASYLDFDLLTIYVGPPTGKVKRVQAQDELLWGRDSETIVEWPMFDNIKRKMGLKSSLDKKRNNPSIASIAESQVEGLRQNLGDMPEPSLITEPGRFIVGPSGLLLLRYAGNH